MHEVVTSARRLTVLVLCAAVILLGWGPPASAAAGNPYAGASGYVDPTSQAASAARAATDPATETALRRIAAQPQFAWFGDWIPPLRARAQATALANSARNAGRVPQVVLYAIPHRDCGSYSAGGLDARSYRAWVREVAAGLRGGRSVVVVEPDALGLLDCLLGAARSERLALLRDALAVLRAAGATAYLDAGNASWHPPAVMAARLRSAGMSTARGVSLNVAGWSATAAQVRYAHALAAHLPGLHALVDTSRNGRGGIPGQWCNVKGQALGTAPRAAADRVVDALVWVKRPGESDGSCGRGEPSAGAFWSTFAADLARRAAP